MHRQVQLIIVFRDGKAVDLSTPYIDGYTDLFNYVRRVADQYRSSSNIIAIRASTLPDRDPIFSTPTAEAKISG